jgi:folate-binding protein YgfZ
MSNEWQQFLSEHGSAATSLQTSADQAILVNLSAYGLLGVEGEDAESFLQNQLSNDVHLVNPANSQLNSYCTPKGRMLVVFRLFKIGDTFYLRMPATMVDSVRKRLQMYVLRSKVRLFDAGDTWQRLGIAGPGSTEQLTKLLDGAPTDINAVSTAGDCIMLRLPGDERFEIVAKLEPAKALWQQLQSSRSTAGNDAWPLLDILAGIPTVYPETSEHFVPQMANMQLIGVVNFKKGCYPGQEVVARMQYRGTLKRRMHLVQLAADHLPAAGTGVVSINDGKAHEAGEIVDARRRDEQHGVALAVLQISSLQDPLHIGDETGPELKLLEMPYAF